MQFESQLGRFENEGPVDLVFCELEVRIVLREIDLEHAYQYIYVREDV